MTEEEKNELESKTIEEIKKLERKKPVLLVGKNKELIQNAVKEIYYTHPKAHCLVISFPSPFGSSDDLVTYFGSSEESKIELREYSCIGKTETEIEHALFSPKNLIGYYKNGDTFFVRGLNIPRILERLADSVEEYCNGVLIINVPSMDIVPQGLLDRFDPIYLEPKKQDTAKQAKFIPFPTPSGTQWHEVGISFIDSENVKISARDKTATKHFFDMGFRKGKTCKPVKSWHTLFAFSEKKCLKYSQSIKSKTEKDIQDLRKRLKAYFGIQDDPIIFDHGYEPVFKVCWSESEGEGRSVRTFSNSAIFDEKEND